MSKASSDQLQAMRHSLAHLLAAAVMDLWPDTKRTIGPAIDNGFYYDFEFTHPISDAHLPEIEDKMRQILPKWDKFERHELTATEAKKEYPGNQFKHELIDEFSEGGKVKVSFYQSGDFRDLCRGGHIENMKQIDPQSFKLTKLAGAYWRGDAQNPQLTRIYGVAFATKPELDDYLAMMEEAEKRDHRKLGKELDLFVNAPLIGSGLPLFTPKGTVLREELNNLSQELRVNQGFQKIWTPHLAKLETYKKSGHFEKFPELMWFKSSETGDELALKPVNCPHHAQIYASQPRSYRDLPIKYLETTTVYRDEKSGEMAGISRVRSITQDDSHVFCTEEQVEAIFAELIEDAQSFYATVDMKLSLRLSFRDDADNYLGDPKAWARAEAAIEKMAKHFQLEYEVGLGEAAIYGPKMDFMATDALGRMTQLATVQLDYAQPERFELEYIDNDGSTKRPIMIHCAILGSLERFLAIYIEHTAGKFPLWLAPEQVRVATVSDDPQVTEAAQALVKQLRAAGLRPFLDDTNESVGKKIRAAEMAKVPFTVVVGGKEVESGKVTPRIRADLASGQEVKAMKTDLFVQTLAHEAKSRVSKSTL